MHARGTLCSVGIAAMRTPAAPVAAQDITVIVNATPRDQAKATPGTVAHVSTSASTSGVKVVDLT